MNASGYWIGRDLDNLSLSWRFLIFAGTLFAAMACYQMLHLDALLPWPLFVGLFPVVLFGLFYVLQKSWQSPLLPFLSIFFVFVTVFIDSFSARSIGLSPKSNQLSFLFSLLFTAVYLLKDFRFYWSHWQIKLSAVFFAVTLIYFFVYASDFDISKVKYGYVLLITAGLEINSPPVRQIILISSLSILVANVLALSPFSAPAATGGGQDRMASLLRVTYSLLAFSLLFIMLCVLSKGAKWNYGMHYYLPLIMLFGCAAFYLVKKHHNNEFAWFLRFPLVKLLGGSLLFSGLFMLLLLNKTSLFGTFLSFALFFGLTRGAGYGDFMKGIWQFAAHNMLAKVLIFFMVAVLLLLGGVFGIFDLFSAKIDYVVSGLAKNSSMKVREGNWQYFLQDWWQTLDVRHVLFGYGIGASRKSIFYISAMRDNPHESNLVQTLHNGYMEYVYDYGVMCLLYFGLYFHFLKKALGSFKNKRGMDASVLAAAQLGVIAYAAFYSLTDGIRVQMLIQIFALLGFMEGLKAYYAGLAPTDS